MFYLILYKRVDGDLPMLRLRGKGIAAAEAGFDLAIRRSRDDRGYGPGVREAPVQLGQFAGRIMISPGRTGLRFRCVEDVGRSSAPLWEKPRNFREPTSAARIRQSSRH